MMRTRGSVLIIVLIFSLLIGMLVTLSMEFGLLQTKTTRSYHFEMMELMNTDQVLREQEQRLMQEVLEDGRTAAYADSKLQFVPDTLMFGERQGLTYYSVDVRGRGDEGTQVHLQSVVALRQ